MRASSAVMRGWAWLPAALLILAASGAQAASSPLELKVKSAFLYNFARLITWPAEKFSTPASPFLICILEPDPFGTILDDSLRGKRVEEHPIVVSRSSRIEELKSCHIVYTDASSASKAEATFATLAGAGVMTVHEGGQPLSGGMARFFLDARKVRFEINATAMAGENLQMSPKLESLAIIVRR